MIHDANQIIPRLWLGNFKSAYNLKFLVNNRINVIVNCTKDLPFIPVEDIYKYRVPVHDNLERYEINAMGVYLRYIIPVIEEHYRHGHVILVHCAAGIQRSAIVVLSFLCTHFNTDPKKAVQLIQKKRPIVFQPFMNFAHSFKIFMGNSKYNRLFTR